jgi:ABC-type Zn uptake system ZnuABC Zn-binding protein ZnuA
LILSIIYGAEEGFLMLQRPAAVGVVSVLLAMTIGWVEAQTERLQIVAAHTILTDVVRNVAGNAADVTSLMPSGADPHSFQPAPQDLAWLADADVIFVNGAGFEEGLLEAIQNAGEDLNIVTASECVEILPFGEHSHEGDDAEGDFDPVTAERCAANYAELAALHTDENEVAGYLGPLYALECGEGDHEAVGEHDHANCDPHVWTDPHNVALWTLTVRDTLSNLDAANADTYAANAANYLNALESLLHDELEPMIEAVPVENRVLVTNHETLGYFAHRFGFEIVGVVISGGSTLAEPSAGEIAALIDTVRAGGVAALFAENTVSPAVAQQIADETGAAFYTLYSDSLSEADGPAGTYLDYMRYNVSTIADALS